MTNKPLNFRNTYVIETGLSDFHKMVIVVMKMHFPKIKPQVSRYQKYKGFHNKIFLDLLKQELNIQGKFLNQKGLDAFSTFCTEFFYKHAPKKAIYTI